MIINLKKCNMHLFLQNDINFIRLSHLVLPIVSVLFFLCLSYHNYHDKKYNEKCKDENARMRDHFWEVDYYKSLEENFFYKPFFMSIIMCISSSMSII